MRNGLNYLLLLFLLTSSLIADEFIIDRFYQDKTDLSARTEARTDVNDEFCAIIKVRTDIDNLKFHSNQLEDIVIKKNEHWLFVSPGIKHLEIIKSGFITKSYLLPERVESSNVYIMELSNRNQTRLNVISFPTSSTGSNIFINGKFTDYQTPHLFKMEPGKYLVTLQHPDFLEMTKQIQLNERETKELVFNLELYEGSDLQKSKFYRGQKRLGFVTGLLLVGAGIGANYMAEQAYNDHLDATTTTAADDNWNKYEQFNTVRDVSYSISILPLLYGTYSWIRETTLKK